METIVNVTADPSVPGALCQPPPAGVRCEAVDRLLDEVLAVEPPVVPPVELVDRINAAKQRLFDADEMLRLDAEQLDEVAALGMILRIDRAAGRALDDSTSLYLDTDDDRWRGVHYGHAVAAATSLLQTVLRQRGEGGD